MVVLRRVVSAIAFVRTLFSQKCGTCGKKIGSIDGCTECESFRNNNQKYSM
jgi:hypothetical protein